MAKLGELVVIAVAALAIVSCTTGSGQGGGYAGSGLQTAVPPAGMTPAQGAAYCTTLAQTYAEYVGSVPPWLGGSFQGGAAADLDARVAIAQCQDGNYAGGIPTLQQKLRDARVPVPPPPV
ncbi:MAG: hypothetical protein U1E21_13605 [Reyranellaceae bacterium]